ncbi:ABC transporter ATP-binding protein [candidate division WWE3 bacterium CG06_land_8_20_14_3_00_42_16]|uniref:ABC transporter ATP-binding protein n=4 Tax=Katanobacteria TaxID=422282 RepID=A0A2M7APP8_UNCKA|nr:MAG: ABC transporter ATP-binding protein [bacterium CG1_02_42_9]PIU69357.1 MAG: ABC transporter ATP-binding protein [candidate division WWE3 bacterium CG06_land_8_20_14_3_00_42_16]PIZ42671.1 MAG: ABC transporter ATP-binding protein [candidate division WWE3 bacterium CG_4_10_14_0_2_um_filter_42_8]PJA37836.1 MAG: ABC transporter ATP-binding protein [candidate division WWE3 bacterium CG_4_9_14_3_um_filter_43_9]PJC69300.1 MAG: ABC transporter ATP-binding protein [candidate division WWE3 bacteriu
MIELKNITKSYLLGKNKILALDNLSLTIKEGDFLAIVGPSGSGKSTLLHLIGGLDRPISGTVFVEGVDIYSQKDKDLAFFRNQKVGFVFQTFNLLPTLTAWENVALPLTFSNVPPKQHKLKALQVLEKVGLGQRASHKPSELSGGESQRVAIGRALINNPQMILADEPTGNLDSKTGGEIMDLFQELNVKEKITIILVTHNQEDAKKARKTYRILDGKII